DNEEWEAVLDDNDMATEHSDLPSMIANDQAPEFAHDGAAVPLEVNPFPSPDWQAAFWQALQHVQEIGHIPSGYGMLEQEWGGNGYPELEEIIVELPGFIWQPRAVRWCQALQVLIHILETAN
ncbi:hypothetical protein EDC04DRAFT_2577166, partial [Pisolithus marmoratus]